MEVKVLSKEKDSFAKDDKVYKLKLLVKGETPNFLNVLRRTILEEVKTLAVDEVYFYENSSAMWDEFIAHRLGLLPINTPEGVKEAKLLLEASKKGYVYAKDVKFDRKDVYIPYEDIPILYLDEDQKVKLEAKVTLGSGKQHAKWEPAHVYYYKLADVKVKKKLTKEEVNKLKELGVEVKGNKIKIPKEKEFDRTFLDSLETISDKIKVVPKEGEYVFVVESFGQLSAEKIVLEGVKEIKEKLKKLLEFFISDINGK